MIATGLALRLGRWGIAGFGALACWAPYIEAQGFYHVAGSTSAERAEFGRNMSAIASRFTILLPPPIRPDTIGGYVQYRAYGGLALLFAVWALASATGAARQDEERGVVEAVIGASLSRGMMIASRIVAFAIGSFAASIAAGIGLILGVLGGGESISVQSTFEAGVVLTVLAVSCYSLTLLISQVTSGRIATASAGLVLLALYLTNNLSHTFKSLSSARWLSPFRYYELSQPLAPGGHFDVLATLMLFGIALFAGAAAAVAFAHRDLGSALFRWPRRHQSASHEVSGFPIWRIPVARGLYDRRLGLATWATCVAALAAISVATTKTMIQPLLSIPALAPYFGGFVHGPVYTMFLGIFWFSLAQLLFAAFAISHVVQWSAEDTDGRLEMIVSNPVARATVVVERAIVLALGAAFVAALSGVVVGIASQNQGMNIASDRLAAATLLLVPFALVFAAVGAALAAWNPRAAMGLLGGFAFFSYMVTEVGPFFKWPEWIQDVSAFKLFGTPLSSGVDRAGLLAMVAIIVVGFGASILVMQRRDVGR
ncbi:MAG: exporter of polyketide antibiotics [Candidatus Dormibacteraceae bacterium]